MSGIFKLFGIGLILLSAFLFSSEYEKRIKKREEVLAGFLSLAERIKRQIDCYLTPPSELALDFCNEALSEIGFLELAKKEGISSAFGSLKSRLPICSAAKEELTRLFEALEKEYKEGALKALDSGISSLKELGARERDENEKDIKVMRALVTAAALGTVILII